MKIKRIAEILRIALLFSEQVSQLIASISIPKEEQKEVEKVLEEASLNLQAAKKYIPIEPVEEI